MYKEISFLIPLYNEEKQILETLKTIRDCVKTRNLLFEIIICDDASTDNSAKVLQNQNIIKINLISHEHNMGFAATYKTCLQNAYGEKVIFLTAGNDIDSYNLGQILDSKDRASVILQYCINKANRSRLRYILSEVFVFVMNYINRINLHYYNGFNIFPLAELRAIEICENSFAFQAEIVSKLVVDRKLSYYELGVECFYDDFRSTALNYLNMVRVTKYIIKRFWSVWIVNG